MEGDAFEMEDQRNWADASFKTYVRPLSKPRPYVIAKGAADRQRITVSVEGKASAPGASGQVPPASRSARRSRACLPSACLSTTPASAACRPQMRRNC